MVKLLFYKEKYLPAKINSKMYTNIKMIIKKIKIRNIFFFLFLTSQVLSVLPLFVLGA